MRCLELDVLPAPKDAIFSVAFLVAISAARRIAVASSFMSSSFVAIMESLLVLLLVP